LSTYAGVEEEKEDDGGLLRGVREEGGDPLKGD
jgi:hypothetical protein